MLMGPVTTKSIGRFYPDLDALPGDAAFPVLDWSRVELRSILRRASDQVVSLLRNDFGAAVHLYAVRNALEEIIVSGELEPLLKTAGMVFTSLDYFFAQTPPPSLGAEDKLVLSPYVRGRARDFFTFNGTQLLLLLGVLRAIPERWMPDELLSDSLYRRFRALPFLEEVSCEATLYPPKPGGIPWLKEQSLQDFDSMAKDCAAAPIPFVLVLRGLDQSQPEVFIANSCRRKGGEQLLLGYCSTQNSSQPMETLLSVNDWGNESITVGGEKRQIVALMRVRYTPRMPPLNRLGRFLHQLGIRRLHWRWRRLGRSGRARRPENSLT
jgi:hypothetical protein